HRMTSVSWSPDGKRLAWDSYNGAITLADVATVAQRQASFRGNEAVWSPKGNHLAVAQQYKISIYDADTGALADCWPTSANYNNPLLWSPDAAHLASVADYAVEVREAATGRVRFPPLRHTQRVKALAWNPDSKQLATATEDNAVH